MVKTSSIMGALIMLLFILSFWLKESSLNKEKKSIFECGFDPSHEKRNAFSLRFFMMTIIFLLFDLEITFILPLPLHMKNNSTLLLNMTHLIVIFFFTTSTYFEWKQGALSWVWLGI